MLLTEVQIDWINRESETLQRIIDSKPEYGLLSYRARQEALFLIIKLHNLEYEARKNASEKAKA